MRQVLTCSSSMALTTSYCSLEFITCEHLWISVTSCFQTSSKDILLSVSLPHFSCPPCLEYCPSAMILLWLWHYINHVLTYLLTYLLTVVNNICTATKLTLSQHRCVLFHQGRLHVHLHLANLILKILLQQLLLFLKHLIQRFPLQSELVLKWTGLRKPWRLFTFSENTQWHTLQITTEKWPHLYVLFCCVCVAVNTLSAFWYCSKLRMKAKTGRPRHSWLVKVKSLQSAPISQRCINCSRQSFRVEGTGETEKNRKRWYLCRCARATVGAKLALVNSHVGSR